MADSQFNQLRFIINCSIANRM